MPSQSFKVGEMLNKRTQNTKTWMNFDGSFTTEIHSGVVHFEDENGNLQNINTDLMDEADFDSIDIPVAREGKEKFREAKTKAKADKAKNKLNRDNFDYQGLFVPFESKIPRNFKKGYTIGKGQNKLTFKPMGASSSKGYVEEGKKNEIQYQDAWNDTDVILEITPDGIKETMILKTDRAPLTFSFEIDGQIEDDLTAGALKLSPAWLEDANKERRDVSQAIRREGEITYIDLVADVEGLVYPIEIDPTVTIQGASQIQDTYVSNYFSFVNSNMSATNSIMVGSSSNETGRGLFKIDLSSIVGKVTSATLNTKVTGVFSQTDNTTFNVHEVLQPFNISTVTWNNQPSIGADIYGTTTRQSTGPMNFNITTLIDKWVSGQSVNNGLMIKALYESHIDNGKVIVSTESTTVSDRPNLSITYNQAPTAPTVTAPNGGETWNSSHTVEWLGSTDSDSTLTTYNHGNGTNNTFSIQAGQKRGYKFSSTNDILKEIQFGFQNLANYVSNNVIVGLYEVETNGVPSQFIVGVNPTIQGSGTYRQFTATFEQIIVPNKEYVVVIEIVGGSTTTFDISGTTLTGTMWVVNSGTTWGTSTYTPWSLVKTTTYKNIRYQIQLSTDNGVNWSDIVALTTAGATQYVHDFINAPQSSTSKIRIRAYDGSSYGPWDESNGVFSIVHNTAPNAPTNLTPITTKDRAGIIRFAWTHNDPENDAQSKFDLDYRVQGSPTWINVTQNTINQYYDLPAGTLPRGTIEWRVRTYDQADLSGPYSDIKTFLAGDKPAKPTTLSPVDGSTVSVSMPTVQWSSVGQVGYTLKVLDATKTTTLWETTQTSNNKAHTIGYDLENQTNYTIQLTIRNSDGITSDVEESDIYVSYTPPAKGQVVAVADNVRGALSIDITHLTPAGTVPNVSSNEIYRRKKGETEWERIAENVLTQTDAGNLYPNPILMNYVGKVAGSLVENPHVFKSYGTTGLLVPSSTSWIERADSKISALDGSSYSSLVNTNGSYIQHLFSFNLIEGIERALGFKIPASDTAGKVAWLKANVSAITANWHGFGSGPLGNKASLAYWVASTSTWNTPQTHSLSSVAKLTMSRNSTSHNIADYVDSNGSLHSIAYAEPSNGTTASIISTDYVELLTSMNVTGKKGSFVDYTTAFGVEYEYFVREIGENGTYTDTDIVSGSVKFESAQLALTTDYSKWVKMKKGASRNKDKSIERVLSEFAGRPQAMAEYGEHDKWMANVSFLIFDVEELNMLDYLIDSRETLLYRDNFGKREFVSVAGYSSEDHPSGWWNVSLTADKVYFVEVI